MDEGGFEQEIIRPYGYTLKGQPCIDSFNWQLKRRTNVIGALYKKTLFAIDYFNQNINWKCVYDWCKNTLIPSLKTKCVIVMDERG
ncbi:transposase [Psychrobacter sp. I-STPA6b]|uniref:transposase n=1 Tax=Psychrobacter sp. I-STPA6b TaxID=2585718 RepID=UPI0022233C30|nr:transposase [Psychrobacter sp. I-STPA6b]